MKKRGILFLVVVLLTCMTMSVFAGAQMETKTGEGETYVIKMYSKNFTGLGSSTPVGKIIKEKFNIDFEFEKFTGDWQEKASLWLAAGDYPEIVYIEQNLDLLRKYINAGVLIALDPLAEQYAPNFLSFYKEALPYMRLNAQDKKIYYWPTGSPEEKEMFQTPFEMVVRMDLLKALGYPKIPENEKEWLNFFIEAKKKVPTVDGRPTVGFSMPLAEPWAVALLPAMSRTGRYQYLGGGKMVMLDCDNNTVDFILKNEYSKEAMKFFNGLYRAGLFDKESFTDKGAQTTEKFNTALILGSIYIKWLSEASNPTLNESGKADMQYIGLPFRLESMNENNDARYNRVMLVRNFDHYAITKKAKHPERIMELINWICTDEGQALLGWGIEGIHYTMEGNKKVPTPEFYNGFNNDPDYLYKQGLGIFGFLTLSTKLDDEGQSAVVELDPTVRFDSYNDEVKEVYAKYGWENYLSPWDKYETKGIDVTEWGAALTLNASSPEAKMMTKIADLHNDATIKLIMAKDDAEFDKIWQDSVNELKALGGEQVIQLIRNQYAEIVAGLK